MPTITQRVMVDRPVEEVWDFISTFENTTRWSRGVLEARQTSDGPLGVGSTLQTVVKAFGRRRTADYLVTEYQPNRAFAFTVTSGPMTSRARYAVEPAGAGTRLTASPILVPTLKRHSQDDLANLKRILEASVAATSGRSAGPTSPIRRWARAPSKKARGSSGPGARAAPAGRSLRRHQDPQDRVDDDLASGDHDQGDDEQDPHRPRADAEPAGQPGADPAQDATLAGPYEPLTTKRFHCCGPP